MPVLCACTVLKSLQEMVTPEGTLYRPDQGVSSCLSAVFSDDFYFITSLFEGELVCVRAKTVHLHRCAADRQQL